ncbi:MAG: histidine phosphatase family protein [Pyrinomonadaceae bacterium]
MIEETPEPRTRFRTIIVFSMLFAIFGAVVLFSYWTTFSRPVTTVIVVRHAEKNIESNNPNPDLSPAGQARAQELAQILGTAGITAIYATQFGRTQQTVQPIASTLGLAITKVDSANAVELVRQIDTKRGETILVAGHSNTVPQIIEILGGGKVADIPETDYDNIFVVTIYRYGKAKVVRFKYGTKSLRSGGQEVIDGLVPAPGQRAGAGLS